MTPEQITQAVVSGQMKHKAAIDVFAALYGATLPSSALVLPCESCGTLVPISAMHSYLVWAPMPGHAAVKGFQCDELQHFGCSEECGLLLAQDCLSNHLLPAARAKRAALASPIQQREDMPDE